MSEARLPVVRCPGCGGALGAFDALSNDSRSAVSVCSACYGVWFDWWAGETAALASELTSLPRSSRGTAHGLGSCPRDRCALEAQPYLDGGPTVSRCPRCMGVFASRARIDELAVFSRHLPESSGTIEDASVWARLWRLFR